MTVRFLLAPFLLKKANAIPLNDDPYLKVVSSLKLAPNKLLYIVTLGREAFLIALTEKSVTLISKIEDKELIDALNLNAENQSIGGKTFADMLSALFKKGGGTGNSSTQRKNTVNRMNNPDAQTAYHNGNTQPHSNMNSTGNLQGEFLAEMRERLNKAETSGTHTKNNNSEQADF